MKNITFVLDSIGSVIVPESKANLVVELIQHKTPIWRKEAARLGPNDPPMIATDLVHTLFDELQIPHRINTNPVYFLAVLTPEEDGSQSVSEPDTDLPAGEEEPVDPEAGESSEPAPDGATPKLEAHEEAPASAAEAPAEKDETPTEETEAPAAEAVTTEEVPLEPVEGSLEPVELTSNGEPSAGGNKGRSGKRGGDKAAAAEPKEAAPEAEGEAPAAEEGNEPVAAGVGESVPATAVLPPW